MEECPIDPMGGVSAALYTYDPIVVSIAYVLGPCFLSLFIEVVNRVVIRVSRVVQFPIVEQGVVRSLILFVRVVVGVSDCHIDKEAWVGRIP